MLLIQSVPGDCSGKERVAWRQGISLLPAVHITQQIWQTPVSRRRNQSSILQRRMIQHSNTENYPNSEHFHTPCYPAVCAYSLLRVFCRVIAILLTSNMICRSGRELTAESDSPLFTISYPPVQKKSVILSWSRNNDELIFKRTTHEHFWGWNLFVSTICLITAPQYSKGKHRLHLCFGTSAKHLASRSTQYSAALVEVNMGSR